MTVGDLMERLKGLPPKTLVCAAEVDEAFGTNIAEVEVVDEATVENSQADGKESIDLGQGREKVVVLRW